MKKIIFSILALLFFNGISSAQNLKLVTYNIRLDLESDGENKWSNRKDFWASQINFYEPDVFGIQEALPHQVTDIASALPGYSYVGIGRDGIGKGESSNIFFKKDRFKMVQEKTFWLSETPEKISKGWDAALNRVCTYVLLKDNKTKKSFWVFNAHLDHIGELARTNAIQLILSKIKEVNTKKLPVFVIGDFNTEPNEQRITDLKKQMDDSYDITKQKPFGPNGTFNAFQYFEPVTKRIDYIFLSKNNPFKVLKHAVLTDAKNLKFPSDHFPVLVEIQLN
jgi:endonuclease/exonuclease/phosphatase family metal-dependent hydrolase